MPLKVGIPPPKMFAVREELGVIRDAVAHRPKSPEHRYRLAHLLQTLDDFDEAIDVLQELIREAADFRVLQMLATALMARERPQDDILAQQFARRAVDAAASRHERASALAALGKIHVRLSQFGEGRARLRDALRSDAGNKDAYKRLAMLDLQAGRDQQALDHADAMNLDGGMYYSLNGPAADVWALLANSIHEQKVVDALVARYKVAPEACAKSVQRLLNDLSEKGLAKQSG